MVAVFPKEVTVSERAVVAESADNVVAAPGKEIVTVPELDAIVVL